MYKNKKAFSQYFIVSLIIVIITLILLLFYINSNINNFRYRQSLNECNIFFNNIKGKPLYFGNKLDEIQISLINSISKLCPSKTIKVSENKIKDAAKLIDDCAYKTGVGVNFLGSNLRGESICIYCGKIITENEILDFKKKLSNELKKEQYIHIFDKNDKNSRSTINLNEVFLGENGAIPSKISKDMSASVFYYIEAPKFPSTDRTTFLTFLSDFYGTKLSKLVGEQGSVFSFGNWFLNQKTPDYFDVYSGILVTHQSEKEIEFGDTNNLVKFRDCYTIIPEKNFG